MRAAILLLLAFAGGAQGEDLAPLQDWIVRQHSVKAIETDFTQTRALRTLRDPVVAQGKFYFRAPSSFRWQVGDPPTIIALGNGKEANLIRPSKKTVERFPADHTGMQGQALGFGMMNLLLAADFADFQRQFEILSLVTSNGQCHIELLPRDARARRLLAKISIEFDVASGKLLTFEIATREGSSLRTEFHDTRINAALDPALFRYDFTGYKISDAK